MIWTKKQLEEQKEEILEEFNFYAVFDFISMLIDYKKTPQKYPKIKELRENAKSVIDSFIEGYLEHGEKYEVYVNGKWLIHMSCEWDGNTPLMKLAYQHSVTDWDASYWGEEYSKNKKDSSYQQEAP